MPEIIIVTPERDDYADAQLERKQHGAILLDGKEVASTLRCPHCGGHFISRRGSGIKRGFCTRCKEITCGSPGCRSCKPLEKMLEEIERAATRASRLGA